MDITPLHDALDAAEAKERPVPWRTRLRHPFARRVPPIRSFIRKHRLWPLIELAYTETLREYGSVRVKMEVPPWDPTFPHVSLDLSVPLSDIEFEVVFEFEEAIHRILDHRFGRETGRKLLITIQPDTDYLPLFDGLPPFPASLAK